MNDIGFEPILNISTYSICRSALLIIGVIIKHMEIQKDNSGNREVTKKDLLQALIVVAYGAIILFAFYNNHKIIAFLLILGAAFFLISAILSMPKESLEKISEEIKRRESSTIGKLLKYCNYFFQSLILIYLIYWAITNFY